MSLSMGEKTVGIVRDTRPSSRAKNHKRVESLPVDNDVASNVQATLMLLPSRSARHGVRKGEHGGVRSLGVSVQGPDERKTRRLGRLPAVSEVVQETQTLRVIKDGGLREAMEVGDQSVAHAVRATC